MLPVFVEPGHGFNLGAEMESLKAELRGRLQRLVNTSESVSKSLFGSTFPEAENTFQLSAFVGTPWKIVFRFIERLLQSRKSFKSFQAFSERLGISKDCVDLPNGELTLPILETVVRRPTPFVVLVREGIVQRIADRAALATRMAVGA
jgi:hypothetical protein